MSSSEQKCRIQRAWIQKILNSSGAKGILITHLPHIRWACGFTGSSGFLIVRENERHLLTDRRYEIQAELEVRGAKVHIGTHNLVESAKKAGLIDSSEQLIIQPEYITLAELNLWETFLGKTSFLPYENLLNRLVAIKSEDDIAGMRRAQAISDTVFNEILRHIKPGVREHELATMIDYHHRMHGASGMAFETIVAFGENSALPHARPSSRELVSDEPILLDFGGIVDGFTSDMTRTLHYGQPGKEFILGYKAVQKAQSRAVNAVCAGAWAADVDRAARSSLKADGFGKFFSHSTGHGIGTEVHEWPRISANSDAKLLRGNTITIEPGVYLPENFGIRIEDTVLVDSFGCEQLSLIERDLIIV